LRRTVGKQHGGKALATRRSTLWDQSLPWGRGEPLRKPEEACSRRSDTIWRWRSIGSTAAGKSRHGGFFGLNISVPNTLWGTAPRSSSSTTNPSSSWFPIIDMIPLAVCLGLLSQRYFAYEGRPMTALITGGGYGRIRHDQTCVGNIRGDGQRI
jgi:hypothetical protein